jgi:hypothetical protein
LVNSAFRPVPRPGSEALGVLTAAESALRAVLAGPPAGRR